MEISFIAGDPSMAGECRRRVNRVADECKVLRSGQGGCAAFLEPLSRDEQENPMSIAMHDAATKPLLQFLDNLAGLVRKAADHAAAKKIDPEALLKARLYPDMFHFLKQVQVACDFAKNTVSRLAGLEPPKHADTETSFEELLVRIETARAVVAAVTPAQLEGSETRIVTIQMRSGEMSFPGAEYLTMFALPNFYFHLTTAYAILRHNGVELGKGNFFGR
jgi:uncharacterized protein